MPPSGIQQNSLCQCIQHSSGKAVGTWRSGPGFQGESSNISSSLLGPRATYTGKDISALAQGPGSWLSCMIGHDVCKVFVLLRNRLGWAVHAKQQPQRAGCRTHDLTDLVHRLDRGCCEVRSKRPPRSSRVGNVTTPERDLPLTRRLPANRTNGATGFSKPWSKAFSTSSSCTS